MLCVVICMWRALQSLTKPCRDLPKEVFFSAPGILGRLPYPSSFYMGSWDLNLSVHACTLQVLCSLDNLPRSCFLLVCFYFWGRVSISLSWSPAHYISQGWSWIASSKVLLSSSPKYWNYKSIPPCSLYEICICV